MGNMKSLEAVTLAIPSFNAATYLPRVLESVGQLTMQPKSVLVIDDGSTDDTAKIATSFSTTIKSLKVISHKINQGLGAARQTALKSCESPWLAMIDSDVCVESEWLGRLFEVAQTSKAAGVGGDLLESEAQTVADRWRARMMAQTHGGAEKAGVPLFGCNTLHSVAALNAVGGFNSRYIRAYEDIDISERLMKAGHKLVYTPTARCLHLRKDTVTSVLRAAYSWRLPRYEDSGVYDDLKTLMGKWIATFKEDFRELKMLLAESNGELSFPCLVQLFANPIQDLSVVVTRNQSMRLRGLAGIGSALILLALKQSLIPDELKAAVGSALKPFIDTLTGQIQKIALPNEDNPELTRLVTATVTPWSTILAFSPADNERMMASAKGSVI